MIATQGLMGLQTECTVCSFSMMLSTIAQRERKPALNS